MTTPLPALPTESSQWDRALYAVLVKIGNRSATESDSEAEGDALIRRTPLFDAPLGAHRLQVRTELDALPQAPQRPID